VRRTLRDLKEAAAWGVALLVLMVVFSTIGSCNRAPLTQAEARRVDADTQARAAEWMLQEQLRTERQAATTAAFNAAVGQVVAAAAWGLRVVAAAVAVTVTIAGVGLAVVTVRANWRRLPDGASVVQMAAGLAVIDPRSGWVQLLTTENAPSLTQAQAITMVRQRALPAAWQGLPRREQWRMVEAQELQALEVGA